MIDLERQIRDYYDGITIPVTTDEYAQLATGQRVPARRSRAWAMAVAFVVVLVGVGVTMLMSGGNGTSFVDQPEPLSTTVTHQSSSTTIGTVSVQPGWQRVAAEEPWVEHIVDLEAIPDGGGFVIRAADPWSVSWSPDGVEWSDADPNRQVTAHEWHRADGRTGAQVLAATGDWVAVLDRTAVGIWLGDSATGDWEQIILDTAGLTDQVELLALAANDRGEILVVGTALGSDVLQPEPDDPGDQPEPFLWIDQYLVWVVDLVNGTTDRHPLPITVGFDIVDDVEVEWLNGGWLIYLARLLHEEPVGRGEGESLLASSDGVTWTTAAAPEEWGMSLTSLTAGPTTMVATVCHFGGDSFWYSENGLDWTKATSSHSGHHSTYSPELGFVIIYGDILVSKEGRTWSGAGTTHDALSGVEFLEASGNTVLVVDGLRDDVVPRLWLWTSE